MMLFLSPEIRSCFNTCHAFDEIMNLKGEIFRELENRRTQKVNLNGKIYFIKQHHGVGWKEIFKNLFQLRLPICSAKNEWVALQQLNRLSILAPTIKGYGCRGYNPATLQSFLITEALPTHISLEEYCGLWEKTPPPFRVKHQLIQKVAWIAKKIHEQGMNHRDFYLCHFLLTTDFALFLIDLHRAQLRRKTPSRWLIKDLAGLYFSSKKIGLTKRDILRFLKEYRNKSLRVILMTESSFWHKVKYRGDKLFQTQS